MGNLASALTLRNDEAALVEELRAGSEEAFAWLLARYHQPIYSLLARTVRDRGDAADLTQEVFVKVFRGIGHFHGEASLRTWIYRIALHEALNQRRWWSRHQKQQVTIEPDGDDRYPSAGESLVDPHDSPFDAAAHAEIAARVESALREVPEPFRTVVVLRDIEGFGYEEIAEILNANLGTVKSRLMRGRAHLKNLLAPYMEAASRKPSRSSSVPRACSAEEAI
jgi:RNA polymerase sigma-70 factor (ECF subfamily)